MSIAEGEHVTEITVEPTAWLASGFDYLEAQIPDAGDSRKMHLARLAIGEQNGLPTINARIFKGKDRDGIELKSDSFIGVVAVRETDDSDWIPAVGVFAHAGSSKMVVRLALEQGAES
jgi:hypothetical protein